MNKYLKLFSVVILLSGFAMVAFTQGPSVSILVPPFDGNPAHFLSGARTWLTPAGSGGTNGISAGTSSTPGQLLVATGTNGTSAAWTNGIPSLEVDSATVTNLNTLITNKWLYAKNNGKVVEAPYVPATNGAAILAPTVTATGAFRSYQGTLTHAGTVTLDFDGATTVNSLQLTGAVTFATSNLATNRTYRLLVIAPSTNCIPTFPAGWHWAGGSPPTLTATKWSFLNLESWGPTDSSVVAAFREEE